MKLRLDAMVLGLVVLLGASIGCGDDDDDSDHEMGDHDKAGSGGKGSAGKGSAGSHADAGTSTDAGSKPSGDEDAGSTPRGELEVAGDWKSEFGDQTISLDDWDGAMVVTFDNDENSAITHVPDDAMYNPDTYSKVVWTEPTKDGFFYCTVDFKLETQKAAEDSEMVADDSDPASGGCGMFPWTKLEPL